jgi:intraflagellar transport protein 52
LEAKVVKAHATLISTTCLKSTESWSTQVRPANLDTVARTIYYKYYHPKEVLVSQGVLNRELNKAAGKRIDGEFADKSAGLTFVYPFGASLNVQKPAVPILSSGTISYPLSRPIGAVYQISNMGGKLMALGGAQMFSDAYIDKEENGKLFDVLVKFLTSGISI